MCLPVAISACCVCVALYMYAVVLGVRRKGEVYGRQGGVYTVCLCHTHYVYCVMFIATLLL